MARPRGRALERARREEALERARTERGARRKRAAVVSLSPPTPGVAFAIVGNQHLAHQGEPHVPYNSSPPSSGPHVGGGVVPWGEAPEGVVPEQWIHNLEDAGVVLAYDCDDCENLVDGLRGLLGANPGKRLLLVNHPGIVDPDGVAHRGAAVAWGRVLYFDDLEPDTRTELDRFIRLYEGIDHHVATTGGHGG